MCHGKSVANSLIISNLCLPGKHSSFIIVCFLTLRHLSKRILSITIFICSCNCVNMLRVVVGKTEVKALIDIIVGVFLSTYLNFVSFV